ncbi:MAG: hypothetical protein VYD19_04030 [Myxococcota bacterium]|nr:hypothetical protein [Myxococcota bacterium]
MFRRLRGKNIQGLLLSLTGLSAMGIIACENTDIFAQRQRGGEEPEASRRALFCSDAEPCPSDPCVTLSCQEGRCEAEDPEVSLGLVDEAELATPLISLAFEAKEAERLEERSPSAAWLLDDRGLYFWDGEPGQALDTLDPPPQETSLLATREGGLVAISAEAQTLTLLDRQGRSGERVELPGPATGFLDGGGLWWVSVYDKGVQLIDASRGGAPVSLRRYDTPGRASALAVSEGFLLVADGFAGLSSLQGSEEATPNRAGELPARLLTPAIEQPSSGQIVDLSSAGDHVLTAEWGAGLGVFQVEALIGPRRLAALTLGAPLTRVQWIGGFYALAWAGSDELLWIDLRSPSTPHVAARLSLDWRPDQVYLNLEGTVVIARSPSEQDGDARYGQLQRLQLICQPR